MISINSLASSLSQITNGLSAPVLALSLAMGSTVSGCSPDRTASDGDGGTMVADGGGGMGGDGGIGGDGGTGGGPLIMGSQYVPAPLHPANAAILPPTRALFVWQLGEIPASRTFENYQFCGTTGPASEIDDPGLCPSEVMLPNISIFFDGLSLDSTFRWKIRARYDGGHYSEWSAVQVFSTDHSLVAWLRMNGDAMDSSVAGNHGTVQGGAGYTTGIDFQALSCDGNNDYVDMGGGLALAGPLSISAWIYGNGTPTSADSGLLNQGALNYAMTYNTDGRVYFYINNAGNNLSAPVSAGAWHHVLGTFNGTTAAGGMRFYVDGVLAGQSASSSATTGATGTLEIGRYLASYFNGRIDNVTIYDGALSDTAVLNEYCATQVASGGAIPPACLP